MENLWFYLLAYITIGIGVIGLVIFSISRIKNYKSEPVITVAQEYLLVAGLASILFGLLLLGIGNISGV